MIKNIMFVSHHQRAFVLVSTLWILTIMTIAASFFAVWTQRAIEQAATLQSDLQADIDQRSTLSTLLYILATQRMTYAGVTTPSPERIRQVAPKDYDPFTGNGLSLLPTGDEIGLDDRVYQGLGDTYFAIQDEAGLVGMNNERSTFYVDRLLQQLGVADEQRPPLLDKLQDYIDADNLHRINGAEAEQYQEQDRIPPSNRPLRSPQEAYRILDWDQQSRLWDKHELGQYSSVLSNEQPNLNTASAKVLQTIAGIDANGAARLIEFRRVYPLDNVNRVYQALGLRLNLDELATFFMVSDNLRLTVWQKNSQRMQQVHIELTPFKGKAPWKAHYTLNLPLSPRYQQQDILYAKTPLFPASLPAK